MCEDVESCEAVRSVDGIIAFTFCVGGEDFSDRSLILNDQDFHEYILRFTRITFSLHKWFTI